MDYKDLGDRIRTQRTLMRLTQAELAKRVGVSTSFIGHVERGSRKASLDKLVDLANVLGLGMDHLLAASLKSKGADNLTPTQRDVMQDILEIVQNHVKDWNKPIE